MKKLLFLLIIMNLSCIKHNQTTVLSNTEWNSIANNFPTINNDFPLYYKYNNSEVKDIVFKLYINCTYLGYEINDSVSKNILNRNDKTIPVRLDSIFRLNYIYDTTEFNNEISYFSEPFYINENIICFSLTFKKSGKIKWQKVYFLKKENNSFRIIMFYDTKKDRFYKAIN